MKNNSKILLYPMISIFSVFYIILINNKSEFGLSVLFIMLSIILAIKPNYILPPLLVASLNENYFVLFEGLTVSRFLTVVYITSSLIIIIMNNKLNKLTHISLLIFMTGYTFLSALTSFTGDPVPAIGMILNFLLVFFMFCVRIEDLSKFINLLSISLTIYLFSILFSILTGNAVYSSDRLVIDEAVNANRMGMALAQMAAFFVAIIGNLQNKKKKIFYTVILSINIFLLILTGSRSALFGLLFGITSLIIIKVYNENKMSKKIIYIFSSLIIVSGVFLTLSGLEFENPILERFSVETIIETKGTNRGDIWYIISKYIIPENLFFGVGFGGMNIVNSIMPYINLKISGTHNILVTIIAQMGLTGLVIYTSIFYKISKDSINTYKKYTLVSIPLIMIFTAFGNGIGEDIFTERFLWIAIGISLMMIQQNNYQISELEFDN